MKYLSHKKAPDNFNYIVDVVFSPPKILRWIGFKDELYQYYGNGTVWFEFENECVGEEADIYTQCELYQIYEHILFIESK